LFVAHWFFEENKHKFFCCNKLWKDILPKARCTAKRYQATLDVGFLEEILK